MRLTIDNHYSCGRSSTTTADIDEPEPEQVADHDSDWWNETVWNETGDGHECTRDCDSLYTVTITAAADPALIGTEREFG